MVQGCHLSALLCHRSNTYGTRRNIRAREVGVDDVGTAAVDGASAGLSRRAREAAVNDGELNKGASPNVAPCTGSQRACPNLIFAEDTVGDGEGFGAGGVHGTAALERDGRLEGRAGDIHCVGRVGENLDSSKQRRAKRTTPGGC